MEHIPVQSTRKLDIGQKQNSLPPSEQDAVVHYSMTIGRRYSTETALKAALVIIECMAREMLSPDSVYLALLSARAKKPAEMNAQDYQDFLQQIAEQLDRSRQKNIMSRMF